VTQPPDDQVEVVVGETAADLVVRIPHFCVLLNSANVAPGFTCAAAAFRMLDAVDESGRTPGRKRSSILMSRGVVATTSFRSPTTNSTSAASVCRTVFGVAANACSSHCSRETTTTAAARLCNSRRESLILVG
jgi:hypothetical protein